MNENDVMKVLDEYFSQDKKFINTSRIPLICQDIRNIHKTLTSIDEKIDKKLVTQDQFWPIKTIVYGATGITLISVFSALIYLVVK